MGLLDPPPLPIWDWAKKILGKTQTADDPSRESFRNAIQAKDMFAPFLVPFPAGFTVGPSSWVPPFTVLRDRAGKFYSTVRGPDLMPRGGISIYVDYSGGNDANDGSSWTQAKKTVNGALISTAYTTIPTPNSPATIYIRPGRYGLGESINSRPLLRDTNLIGIDGTPELSSAQYGDRVTWTAEPGVGANVWSTPYVAVDGFNLTIFDEGNLDADGLPTFINEASGIGTVGTSVNRHLVNSNKLYVHMVDNSKPGTRVAWAANNADTNSITSASDGFKFYAENIRFAYGAHGFHSTGNTGQVVLYNCEAFGGFNKGFESEKAHPTLTWLENCRARRNAQDGLSYRGSARAVEINCESIRNGYQAAVTLGGSNNGSTTHDSSRLVRLGGQYIYNADRNVHDITASRSFNCGVTAGYTLTAGLTADPYQSANFVASYLGDTSVSCRMWLLECYSEGSVGDYNVYHSAIMYRRDCSPGVDTAADNGSFSTF